MLGLAVYCTLLAGYTHVVFSKPTSYDQRQSGDLNVQIHVKDVQVIALLDSDLLSGYTDYDYAYDYSDFTIKPILKPTTSKPSSVSTSSEKPLSTSSTAEPSTTSSSVTTTSNDLVDAETSSSKDNVTQESSTASSVDTIETTTIEMNKDAKDNVTQESSTTSSVDNVETTTIEINKDAIVVVNGNNETIIKLRINDKVGNKLFNVEDVKKVSPTARQPNLRKFCPTGYAPDNKKRCQRVQKRRRVALLPLALGLNPKLSERGRLTITKDLPIRVYKSEPRQ